MKYLHVEYGISKEYFELELSPVLFEMPMKKFLFEVVKKCGFYLSKKSFPMFPCKV
jgi:hypothetical protein